MKKILVTTSATVLGLWLSGCSTFPLGSPSGNAPIERRAPSATTTASTSASNAASTSTPKPVTPAPTPASPSAAQTASVNQPSASSVQNEAAPQAPSTAVKPIPLPLSPQKAAAEAAAAAVADKTKGTTKVTGPARAIDEARKDHAADGVGPLGVVTEPSTQTPSPIEVGKTPLPPLQANDLWDRMRAGFRMPELNTPLVAEKERFYLSKPDYLQRMFTRGSRYLYFIMEEIDKRGMPMELALLPFVESAMVPNAMSHAAASGLWQFIPSTGRQYNLSQNWWVDNRRDVAKATVAALEYLDKLYKMQGNDWFLALASYNWGEGSVQRAMRTNAARGLPTDYLSLSMPNETRHYVPKLIALRNIVLKARDLGVDLPETPNQPYFVAIEKTRPIDLKLAAQFAGMSVTDFVALNPAHNRPVIAASKNNQILIPSSRYQGFLNAIEQHAAANRVFATWQPRTIGAGESIDSIAAAGGVTVAELRRANGLKAHQRILPGTRIIAPQQRVKDESQVESFVAPRVVEAVNVPAQRHVVRRKETLNSIAKRYGVSVAALKAWNGIKRGVSRGVSLIVRPAYAQTVVTNESGSRAVVASTQVKQLASASVDKDDSADEPVVKSRGKANKKSSRKASKADKSKKVEVVSGGRLGRSKSVAKGKSKASAKLVAKRSDSATPGGKKKRRA